jgi:rubrerythrin
MPVTFSGTALIDIATGIESRGMAFYDVMAESAKSESAQNVFRMLADAEREHLRVFESLRGEAANYGVPGIYPHADNDYIQALLNTAIFNDKFAISEMSSRTRNDRDALEAGIDAEKDSILFYYQLKEMMPEQLRPLVDKILEEERNHLILLSGLKNLGSL